MISASSRCANCFDCPCCMHTLSTRATNIPAPVPDDPTKTTMKKAYYLACGFCRWTSRDVGMADKSVGWCSKKKKTIKINKYKSCSHLTYHSYFKSQPAVDGRSQRTPTRSGYVYPCGAVKLLTCFLIMHCSLLKPVTITHTMPKQEGKCCLDITISPYIYLFIYLYVC